MGSQDKDLLTMREVAEMLGEPLSNVKYWVYNNKIKHVKIGRRVFIPREEAERFLRQRKPEKLPEDKVINDLARYIARNTGLNFRSVKSKLKSLVKDGVDIRKVKRVEIVHGIVIGDDLDHAPVAGVDKSDYELFFDVKTKTLIVAPNFSKVCRFVYRKKQTSG